MPSKSHKTLFVALAGGVVVSAAATIAWKWFQKEKGKKKDSSSTDLETFLVNAAVKGNCHFRDMKEVVAKAIILKQRGKDHIKVFTDFDMTLTPFKGQKVSYKVLEESSLLSDSYRRKTVALFDHFYPLEQNPTLSFSEKEAMMAEWWSRAHDLLLLEKKFRTTMLPEMVEALDVRLRPHCLDLLSFFHSKNIPVAIVSAGVKNIVEDVIDYNCKLEGKRFSKGIHVVGNEMLCDSEGRLVGWGPLIHSLNKPATLEEMEQDMTRGSLIVIGDHFQDAFMARRIHSDIQLRIGFLNHENGHALDEFMENYDIVLTGDQDMQFLLSFFNSLLN